MHPIDRRKRITMTYLSAVLCLVCTTLTSVRSLASDPGNHLTNQDAVINVQDYGAKGDGVTDDSQAFQKAMMDCINNHKRCYIPKTKSSYLLVNSVRIVMSGSQSLAISSNGATLKGGALMDGSNNIWNLSSFRFHNLLSIGPVVANHVYKTAFDNNSNINVSVSGLHFEGSYVKDQGTPDGYNGDLAVGIEVSAGSLTIKDCHFKHFYGFAILSHGAQSFNCSQCDFDDIGGRGNTVFANKKDNDAFGDAIHLSGIKNGGTISISDCMIDGKKNDSKRSRCGITFELDYFPYTATISHCTIGGYAHSIHIEEHVASNFKISDCDLSDFNFAIVNSMNNGATVNIENTRFNIGMTDGEDAGDVNSFLNYQTTAQVSCSGCTFTYEGKPNAWLNMNGVISLDNCIIEGNGKNFFFADGNTVFNNCRFINFGGNSFSFISHDPKNTFTIQNSSFTGGKVFPAKGTRLNIVSSTHAMGGAMLQAQ